jgi:hypothetical protein
LRSNDKSIKEVLNDFLSDNSRVARGYYTSHIDEVWKSEMGALISGYTQKITFSNGVLKVYLTSSVLKKELSMGKDKIIKNLNKALGRDIVEKVEIF